MTKKIGLLGSRINYSLSPTLHNTALKAVGLDWEYSLLDTEPEKLPRVVDKLRREDWAGVNVTIPYKQAVLPLLDDLDPSASSVGAVNTIVNCNGRLIGHNTDAIGLARDLERLNIQVPGKDVVIIGAGGAAAAVLAVVRDSQVRIICRREKQGRELVQMLMTPAIVFPWETPPVTCDLLFNCTPPGSHWQKFTPGSGVIYDLNYHEPEPPQGNYYNGLGMLVFQAAESFRLWTGFDPITAMATAAGLRL